MVIEFFFLLPAGLKKPCLGSAFVAVNMAHFSQLQLRSVDNRGNCSSQHCDPVVHYSGLPVLFPWRWGHLSIVELSSLPSPDAAPLPSPPGQSSLLWPQQPDTEVG